MSGADAERRRLVAIMFTDMVGYSRLAQRNEAAAIDLLEEQRTILRAEFGRFGGMEADCVGDGFFVQFESALEATRCAVAIQTKLAARNSGAPPDAAINVRIGIHVGDVVHRGNKVMGDSVNIAARIEPLAPPGGICVSGTVYDQIHNKIEHPLVRLRDPSLKNIASKVDVYRIELDEHRPAEDSPAGGAAAGAGTAPRRSSAKSLAFVAGLVAVAAVVWITFEKFHRGPERRPSKAVTQTPVPSAAPARPGPGLITSLAVLPLHNLSGDSNQDYFVDGITRMLSSELSTVSALKKVTSPTTMMLYKNERKSIREIARELAVDGLVEGAVQRDGPLVLISIQLTEGATERQFWATNFQRELGNILKLEADVARAIADEIKAKLTPNEAGRLAQAAAVAPDAFEVYLRGRDALETFDMQHAREWLEEAIRLDPNNARAHASLAHWHIGAAFVGDKRPRLLLEQTKQSALRALEIDSSLTDGRTALGWAKMMLDWDWAGAEQEFRQALRISPNDAGGHALLGFMLTALGRFDEGQAAMTRAQELNPLAIDSKIWAHFPALMGGHSDEVIRDGKVLLQQDPKFFPILSVMGLAYLEKGEFQEALTTYRELLSHHNSGWEVQGQAGLASALALSGQREEALKILNTLKDPSRTYLPAYEIAFVCTALDQRDDALSWLNRSYEDRSGPIYLANVQPAFRPLRSDPRFRALLRKMNLEDASHSSSAK